MAVETALPTELMLLLSQLESSQSGEVLARSTAYGRLISLDLQILLTVVQPWDDF